MFDAAAGKGTILLLGNYRPSLTLARTLSAEGYEIHVGSRGCDKGCEYSRYVSQMWPHSDCKQHPKRFLAELQAYANGRNDLTRIIHDGV